MEKPMQFFSQYCITIGLLCVLIYLYGFFPIKNVSEIYSSEEDVPSSIKDLKFHKENVYNSSVSKTVLMVIDGLRVDFVSPVNFPYMSKVLAGDIGDSCQLTARVSAPTVTLPRIKAIVTGSVSGFIDVVLNFGTVELTSDNIIQQFSRTRKSVFYGDETWIKLFPQQFIRSEGTSSFFVNDYTEVDNNVTRHLDKELQRSDWDLMILHYLGLDHIGHIEGPKSSLIRPKLREMDGIIERLHTYLSKQGKGVLVVCGDHGMKDSGSHGGVSLPEVLVPVIVLGLSCPHHVRQEILQIDLAATLSVLWGTPIPADNIGVVSRTLITHLTPAQRLFAHLHNARQLANNFLRNGGSSLDESYHKYEKAQEMHFKWLINPNLSPYYEIETLYQESLLKMSRFLSEVLANYNLLAMFSAMVILLQVLCLVGLKLIGVASVLNTVSVLLLSTVLVTLSVTSIVTSISQVVGVASSLFIFNSLLLYRQLQQILASCKIFEIMQFSFGWHEGVILVGTILFYVSLFSSSLIEEEHQLWYFLWATVSTLRLVQNPARWLAVLAAHRFLRTINQTGDKWAHLPDLSDWLIQSDNRALLSILCAISLMGMIWCCVKVHSDRFSVFLYICTALCIYQYKASTQQVFSFIPPWSTNGVTEARLCWLMLLILLLKGRSFSGVLVCWMLAICLLLRPHNTLLVPCLFIISKTVATDTALHIWLGNVFYFYQGNSNSLASIDLSAGFVGLEQYNILMVAVLLFMHTYAMPVMAYLLNVHSIINQIRGWKLKLVTSTEVVVFLQLLHVFVCLIVITLHRYHLFVWTVFSPKLLYVAAQTFVYFLLVSITNLCIYVYQFKNHLCYI